MDFKKLQEELSGQVNRDYTSGYNHINNERTRKLESLDRVFNPVIPDGQVRVNLVWKNIQLENALFLTDELDVKFLTSTGVLGKEIMKNLNYMARYDDQDMDLYSMRETIVNHNSLFGLSVTVIDGWDEVETQPISDTINPLNCIPDPKNYNNSKCRFFGINRRVLKSYLESSAFDKKQVKNIQGGENQDITRVERATNQANNQRDICDNDGMVDIYDHFMIHNGNKVLTTWTDDRTNLIRYVIIEPLTNAEKKNPNKVRYPVQFHRRKPIFGRFMGASIIDEVLMYQDLISQLLNLQLINTRINALGPDLFIDSSLGIDTSIMESTKPGGRILPISNKTGRSTQEGLFFSQTPPPNQYTDIMIQNLEQRAEETTAVGRQQFGETQTGSQTKAETQILQQNANKILSWIASNYQRGYKDYWSGHYRCYTLYMGTKDKKNISLWQKGNAISLELEKKDFVGDGKVNIFIVSKAQETLENDKEFNKLTFISNLYLPNIKSEYAKNELLRLIGEKSNVRDFDSSKYIRENADEMNAKANLELLNNNIEVPSPKIDQDPDIYLDIYKQGMNNEATRKAIKEYSLFSQMKEREEKIMGMQEQGVGNTQVQNMAQNNINQDAQNNIK